MKKVQIVKCLKCGEAIFLGMSDWEETKDGEGWLCDDCAKGES